MVLVPTHLLLNDFISIINYKTHLKSVRSY